MKDRMWIGTDGDGLYLYDRNTMRHFRYNASDKIPSRATASMMW